MRFPRLNTRKQLAAEDTPWWGCSLCGYGPFQRAVKPARCGSCQSVDNRDIVEIPADEVDSWSPSAPGAPDPKILDTMRLMREQMALQDEQIEALKKLLAERKK